MDELKNRTVLLVDDEADSVAPLIRVLEKRGCRTAYAENSEAALKLASEIHPDLIIVDVVLGHESGFDLFRTYRDREDTRSTPILFLSGLDEEDNRVVGLSLGAGDFIRKPYNLRETAARVALQLRLKDNEEELRKKNAELTKAYEDLRAAQAVAVHAEKLAAIGRLAAGIAHEMSTPLSFIISNLQILGNYVADIGEVLSAYHGVVVSCSAGQGEGGLIGEADEALDLRKRLDIDAVLRELKDLSRDCLEGAETIAKIASDLREFSREEFEDRVESDLNALIEKALNLARNEIGEGLRVEREFADLPPLRCVPGRVTQLFLIVLVNAAQAIRGEGTIAVRTRVEDGEIEAAIADTGCGMEPEVVEHIFEPFYTTKPAEMGTGLGMSIALKVAESHGGRIEIESRVGRGTTVRIRFPLEPDEARVAETGENG